VSQQHGQFVVLPRYTGLVTATVHPSSILRARTDADRAAAFDSFVADLKKVAQVLKS
jgi:uracil-DNA glycosylase